MVKTFVDDTSRAAPSTDRGLMVAFRLELATRFAGSGLAIAAHETPVHPVQYRRAAYWWLDPAIRRTLYLTAALCILRTRRTPT